MALVIKINFGEAVRIGNAVIRIERFRADQVKLAIVAPKEVNVTRLGETYDVNEFKMKEKKNENE